MIIDRIVVLHSFKDGGFESRLQQIAANPDLDQMSFRHVCVVDRDRGGRRIAEMDHIGNQLSSLGMPPQERSSLKGAYQELLEEIVRDEIGPLLDEYITSFVPDLVLVHRGTVFNAVPGACIAVFDMLLAKHPRVSFALEGKRDWLIDRTRRDYPPFERRWAINQNRWAQANFVEDPQVETVIKAIFG